MSTPEGIVEKAIFRYLRSREIFAFKVKTIGTWDQAIKRYRTPSGNYRKGVSDIIGIYNGRPLAIEVKSAKGRVSPEQKQFLQDWADNGGIAIVARSPEDVADRLNHWNVMKEVEEV